MRSTSTQASKLPTPLEGALKTATETVENVAAETKVVAAKVEKRVKTATASAKKAGKAIAREPKAFSVTLRKDLTKKAGEVKAEVTKETRRFAEEVSGRVNKAIEGTVEKVFHRFNVPTRQELRTLTKKVDELGKKIDTLQKGRTTRTPRVVARTPRTKIAK